MKKKENISILDKEIWEDYIKNPKDIFDKDKSNLTSDHRKNTYKFDLHGYTLLEANKKIREIIIKCQNDRFGKILLITGKGLHSNSDKDTYVSKKLSKLKFSVPEYIKSQKDLLDRIISIEPAEIKDGGDGAYVINLKKL